MLTAATLGLAGYGLYSAIYGAVDLFRPESLDFWADLALIIFGLLLTVSAAFVRVLIPGGLILAIGALLGLEATALYNSAHVHGRVLPLAAHRPGRVLGVARPAGVRGGTAGARRQKLGVRS